ncbi:hypothetical protein BJ878DRAFT_417509 [Calycina marina]|uniref:Uncharacterized protein n=1 Tax=Calycina marina TaxID=1763456 RepID=A0A9P7Z747_9HELO|nr:hypothetical protein BJ878DRAFT_417509 [Calycina marina]
MSSESQLSIVDRTKEVQLPGFGLRVNHLPNWHPDMSKSERFPHAIADFFAGQGVCKREKRMLDFINKISDKPEWERKVFDEAIVAKWHSEAVVHNNALHDFVLSENMFEYCIRELQEKAEIYKTTGTIAVLDYQATVVKSDTAVEKELRDSLVGHVRILEDVPEHMMDWHPGSGGQVLDLVHPSLFPLVYGVSRALRRGTVPLDGCTTFTGMGEMVAKTHSDVSTIFKRKMAWGTGHSLKPWGAFQWLPSNIAFGQDGKVKISSYINSLQPNTHAKLYKVLEEFVDRSIPLWNESLSWFHERIRIPISGGGDEDYYMPEGLKYERSLQPDDEDADDEYEYDEYEDDYQEWIKEHRILKQVEPRDFRLFEDTLKDATNGASRIDLREKFASSGLQVIFKLANIYLTPKDPVYEGGSWHVEGALNEHICATALYYYSQDNITESHLAFRQSMDAQEMAMKPPQNEFQSLEEYYGISNEEAAIQELGKILTRQDRLLAFPNVLQHSVQRFELADKTKPGHRKLLAMFLVDPHVRILSTANIPPQDRRWWAEEIRNIEPFASLPRELFEKIVEHVEGFPISWEKALKYRQNLMDERGAMADALNEAMEQVR